MFLLSVATGKTALREALKIRLYAPLLFQPTLRRAAQQRDHIMIPRLDGDWRRPVESHLIQRGCNSRLVLHPLPANIREKRIGKILRLIDNHITTFTLHRYRKRRVLRIHDDSVAQRDAVMRQPQLEACLMLFGGNGVTSKYDLPGSSGDDHRTPLHQILIDRKQLLLIQ